jgi:hypothetical protein
VGGWLATTWVWYMVSGNTQTMQSIIENVSVEFDTAACENVEDIRVLSVLRVRFQNVHSR